MMKVNVRKARVHVTVRFWAKGSVMAETVETQCTGVETRLEIESDEDPIRIAKLARVSEQGCFVIQTVKRPTPVTYAVLLNGRPIEICKKPEVRV